MSIKRFSKFDLTEAENTAIQSKAEKYNISVEVLEEVFSRGVDAWTVDSNKTPQQYAFNRVNSFIFGGMARKIDEDLVAKLSNVVDISSTDVINERNLMRDDPAQYVSVNRRVTSTSKIRQKHNEREKAMYHTTRTNKARNISWKSRGNKDAHLTNKAGTQLTDRWTAERRKRIGQLRNTKNLGESYHIIGKKKGELWASKPHLTQSAADKEHARLSKSPHLTDLKVVKFKSLSESKEYIENRKAIHDAHAEVGRQLVNSERNPELRQIHAARYKKHEHASRVLGIIAAMRNKKK